MARRMDRPDLLSAALDSRGATSLLVGGYGLAWKDQAARQELAPRLEDQTELIDIYSTSAWALAHIGEFRRVADLARRGVALSDNLSVSHSGPAAFLAVAQYRLGEWDAYWKTFTAAEAQFDPEKPLRYHAFRMYGIAAYLREVAGDSASADGFIERVDQSQGAQGAVGVSGARLWIVITLIRRGAFADARRRLDVEDPVRGIQNRDLDLEAWADLVAAEGAWNEAGDVVAEAREWASRTGLLFLPAVADRLDGQAALGAGESGRAVELLERARATFSNLETPWERARTELSLAQAYRGSGRRAETAKTAQAALDTFTALRAPVEIEQATTLATEAREIAG